MATAAQIEPIKTLLENLLIGDALNHGALTVVPFLAPAADEPDWLTLAAGDRVRVTVLLDGEQLVGAKQASERSTALLGKCLSALSLLRARV